MMPIVVRYFIPTLGVKVKLLDFSSEKGETSEIIASMIKKAADKNNILDKIFGFCGDNCPTNFGSYDRQGQNNVFYRLKEWRPQLIGVGCSAHIVHNALKYACDALPLDIECIVVKIYSHFYINTVRVESLKSLCEDKGIDFAQILSYSKTRFLGLGPAIRSILKVFEPLQEYFLGMGHHCPSILKSFFRSELSKLWFLFVYDQCTYFHETTLKIESDYISAVDVAAQLEILRLNLTLRKEEQYVDPKTEEEMKRVENQEYFNSEIKEVFTQFYDDANEYLLKWTEELNFFKSFSWVQLNCFPDWNSVKKSMQIISQKTYFDYIEKSSAVFEQFGYIKNFCTPEKISFWKSEKTPTATRWVEIFKHMDTEQVSLKEFAEIIEFILCFPGSSAPVERVFSNVKKLWKPESSQLSIQTLNSLLFVKTNIEYNCIDFYNFLKTKPELLRKISAQDKYTFKSVEAYENLDMSIIYVLKQ